MIYNRILTNSFETIYKVKSVNSQAKTKILNLSLVFVLYTGRMKTETKEVISTFTKNGSYQWAGIYSAGGNGMHALNTFIQIPFKQ